MAEQSAYSRSATVHDPLRPRIGAFLADSGGLCYWASSDLCDLTGLSRHDLLGQFWFRVFSERDRKDAIARWEASVQSGVPFSFLGTLENGGKRGARFLVHSELIPAVDNNSGYMLGFVLEAPDAAKNPRYDRLSETIDKLQRTERERFDLTAALNIADTTVNQLQAELNKALQRNQELSKRVDELGKNLSTVEADLAQTCSAKFGLEAQISELEATHGRTVEQQQNELVSIRSELEAKLLAKTEEVQKLSKERDTLTAENSELRAKSDAATVQREKVESEKRTTEKELGEKIRSLEAAVERERAFSRTKLEEKDREHAKSKAELDAQLLKMLGEASDLLSTKKQLSERIASMDRVIEKADEREKELLGRIQALETQALSDKAAASTQDESQRKITALESQLQSERKKNSDLMTRLTDLGERLAHAQEEVEDGKQAVRAISNQAAKIDELKARYELDLAEARTNARDLQASFEQFKSQSAAEKKELQSALDARAQSHSGSYDQALDQVGKHLSRLFQQLFAFLNSLPLSEDQGRSVGAIKISTEYIAKVIATTIDILALENRTSSFSKDRIHFKRQLRQLGGLFEFKSSQRQISFVCDIDDKISDPLWGDWNRLEHVVSTLLGSLLTLLPSQAAIRLSITLGRQTAESQTCLFTAQCSQIEDPALAQKILAYAASSTAFAAQSPEGLGFALCRRLLEMMGSDLVCAESEEGIQARFSASFSTNEQASLKQETLQLSAPAPSVLLPAPAPTQPETLPAIRVEETRPKLKVLLAEDNRINQNTIARFLKRHNYEVTIAANGKEAVERAQSKFYDIVLMDCQMPHLDGYQTTRSIRQHQQNRGQRSTIVGMSAHLDMDGRERCLAVGMDEYLSKPIQEAKLIELLQKLTSN